MECDHSTKQRNRIVATCAAICFAAAGAANLSAAPQDQNHGAVNQSRRPALVVSQNSAPSEPGDVHRAASRTKSKRTVHHNGSTATGGEDWHASPYNKNTVVVDTPRSRDAKLRSGAPPYQK